MLDAPTAGTPRRAQRAGFTLIEVLVAVAIFALIGIAAAGLLGRTLDARAITETRSERLLALQRAVARFERDALQFAHRPVRDEFGDAQPALRLDDGALAMTTRGRRNPLALPRSALTRIRWYLEEDGTLRRRSWPVLDRAQDTEPLEQTVLEDVRALEFELLSADGGSHVDWPAEGLSAAGGGQEAPTEGAEAIPRALRIALDVEPWGRVERLLRLPEPVTLDDEEPAQRAEGQPGAAPGGATQAPAGAAADADG